MKYNILYENSSPLLHILLYPGEAISAKSSALVGMSLDVQVETKIRPGFKSFGSGYDSTVFIHTFRARGDGGEVLLAPQQIGALHRLRLGSPSLVRPGAYLASSEGVNIDTKWGGGGAVFSEGFRMLRCSGRYTAYLFVSCYGALHPIRLNQGDSYVVDPGHLVAFNESVRFRTRQLGGVKPSMAASEGLVLELQGPGDVLLQTRNPEYFAEGALEDLGETA